MRINKILYAFNKQEYSERGDDMPVMKNAIIITAASPPVHVDINKPIQDWKEAQLGREVRAANVTALTLLQEQTNAAVDYITEKGTAADQAVVDVEIVRQAAQDAVDHANDISAEYKQYADTKLIETTEQRQLAETAKLGADSAAALAESWAIGGTGSREGEDDNNSKAHADRAKTEADRSATEADRAAQYANIVAPGFLVDLETMELYMKAGVGVDFVVADDNILCWKVS